MRKLSNNHWRKPTLISVTVLITAAVAMSGCASRSNDSHELKRFSAPVRVKTLEETRQSQQSEPSVIPVHAIHHVGYVSLSDVAYAGNYHGSWLADGSYGIGDRDAEWKFRTGSSKAVKAGRTIQMPAPAVKESNRLYVPVSGLSRLFSPELTLRSNGDSISLLPRAIQREPGVSGQGHAFADAKGSSSSDPGAQTSSGTDQRGQYEAKALTDSQRLQIASTSDSAKADAIINKARTLMGIRYVFGSADYKSSGTFDCSSFVQYLFSTLAGIDLPRTASEQAEKGTAVTRDNLKKGDLLFFYVPGRFKTDTAVGHVGIYMGDGKMIHSSPAPDDGVQISDINTSYWQETFLRARRLLS